MGSVASCMNLAGEVKGGAVVQVNPVVMAGEGVAGKQSHTKCSRRHSSISRQARIRNGKNHSITTSLQGMEGEGKSHSLGRSACMNRSQCNGVTGVSVLEEAATLKLKLLLQQLDKGQVPSIAELRRTVGLAYDALSAGQREEGTVKSEEEKLESIGDRQVREWLSTTFTRTDSLYETHHVPMTPIVKFKAAANTIIITQYFGSMRRDSLPNALQWSPVLTQHLQQVDSWEFDMFAMERVSEGQPLRYLSHQLFKSHNLFDKCGISVSRFDAFLVRIEEGYNRHANPYHNAIHGADVAQTLHCMLVATRLKEVMTELEVMGSLLAAIIHDVDHPGTTNNFQINQRSEYALLYNDRSVLENHHLCYAFTLLQESNCNFLNVLSADDYKQLRTLIVDMVLATDMSSHFDQLKHMRHVMSQDEPGSMLMDTERSKVFCLLLHMCDISHPGKPWALHKEWSVRLAEEFYRQGDREKNLALPLSPLCDRNHGNLPTSQIGFIDYIVMPAFELCGDVLELLLSTPPVSPSSGPPSPPTTTTTPPDSLTPSSPTTHPSPCTSPPPQPVHLRKLWEHHLQHNKHCWEQEQRNTGSEVAKTGTKVAQRSQVNVPQRSEVEVSKTTHNGIARQHVSSLSSSHGSMEREGSEGMEGSMEDNSESSMCSSISTSTILNGSEELQT